VAWFRRRAPGTTLQKVRDYPEVFDLSVNLWRQNVLPSREAIIRTVLFALALVSLAYAVVTAPRVGIDLKFFQTGAREWADGTFQIGVGVVGVYTPFLLPLLFPIAFVPFDTLVVLWLALNIGSAVLSLHFVNKLWGERWPLKARFALAAFFIASAPFRVTLRNGQISLMVTALLLGSLLARKRNKNFLAGALLGISLCKYTLTLPFFLYFGCKREWKLVSTAILVPLALTEVFAWRLGLSLFQVIRQYVPLASQILFSGLPGRTGTTEIKLLFVDLSGGNEWFAAILTLVLSTTALVCMAIVFSRKPRWETAHFVALALFSLWSVYHRTYDSVLCLMAAAMMTDLLIKKRFVAFSRFWLGALGLLVVSIPGLLVDRLKLDPASFAGNPFFVLGVHIERILVFGMFWSVLFLIWKTPDTGNSFVNVVDHAAEEVAP
jgi:glycosyl transferase family 87